MFQILPPSQIIKCEDIISCFQTIYNFLFILLLVFAFIRFIYGAIQYLLSGAAIFPKEEGKKKMLGSLIAIIIVLIIPSILKLVNPEVFADIKMKIPKVYVTSPTIMISLEEVEISELKLSDEQINSRIQCPKMKAKMETKLEERKSYDPNWQWRRVFGDTRLRNISIYGNDKDNTEYINPALKKIIIDFDKKLSTNNIKIKVTDGYSLNDHISRAHTHYGSAIDIVIVDDKGQPINPSHESWEKVIEIALNSGFCVLDERFKNGSSYWSGSHLHLEVRP